MKDRRPICYTEHTMISKTTLVSLYVDKCFSMNEIAVQLGCTNNQVVYWMLKHNIERRSISEAIYRKRNPNGDPFKMKSISTIRDAELLGMGIGLYWGEGNKLNRHSVKLGNTDPGVIKVFIKFLIEICGIDENKLKYSLQIFSDIDQDEALDYWIKELNTDASKFSKVTVTPSGSIGTYKKKSKYGVLIVYFHNYKLRDIIVKMCRDSSVGRAHAW